ncbi:glycosyltransferase [Aquipuribacter sp. SD81]|uniref:glycosyltransferase n=1 Tax=Aquipuribacter sp. SD81 TaxID=3127703 RepID=UPI0030171968
MSRALRRAGSVLTTTGTLLACALTAHTVVNAARLRRPPDDPPETTERVSVLVPARDEAATLPRLLERLAEQVGVPDLEILVCDDRSSDGTADVVRAAARRDPRVRLVEGAEPPPGWLGKPHACDRLARAATGDVLVLVDADVVLAPHAVAATVALLRGSGLDLVSPYPRQEAVTAGERLVQPLLQWSWLTTLPLGPAERSPRASLAAANGQLLAVDAAAYRRAGGHAAVAGEVLEDIALLRAVKRTGGRGVPCDGSTVASCRMYSSWQEVEAGYTKSLWSAFGSAPGAAAVMAVLLLTYVWPAAAALLGSRVGAVGYLAGVAGRYVAAERTGGRSLPDALAHPASVAAAAWLTARSFAGRRSGTLTWKGRPVGTHRRRDGR